MTNERNMVLESSDIEPRSTIQMDTYTQNSDMVDALCTFF